MRLIISLILLTLVPPTFSKEINIKDSRIWSIESAKNMRKWIIIHNLETGKQTGIYHIEIIGRKKGNPTWKIDHLVRHMAITENALKASIKNPLTTGDVYPESFQSAFNSWSKENNGKGGFVCEKSILDCIK